MARAEADGTWLTEMKTIAAEVATPVPLAIVGDAEDSNVWRWSVTVPGPQELPIFERCGTALSLVQAEEMVDAAMREFERLQEEILSLWRKV